MNSPNLAIWHHAPTGHWGTLTEHGISASATIFDSTECEYFTMVGTETGQLGKAFDPDAGYTNFGAGLSIASTPSILTGSYHASYVVTLAALVGAQYLDDRYFILPYSATETLAVWFGSGPAYGPATLANRVVYVDNYGVTALSIAAAIALEFVGDADFMVSARSNGTALFVGTAAIATNGITPDTGDANLPIAPFGSVITGTFTVDESLCVGVWACIVDSTGQLRHWVRVVGAINGTPAYLVIDQSIPEDTKLPIPFFPLGALAGLHGIFFAIVPCSARTYFDLQTPATAKRNKELWMVTQNNAVVGDGELQGQHVFFYREFDETPHSTFRPVQDLRPGSTSADSVNWPTKTAIPTTLLNQFGIGFVEYGSDAWRLMGFLVKYDDGRH